LLSSVVTAIAAQQPPQAAAKPDTADVKTMIDAKVDVLLQNHMLMDPIQDKLAKLTARKPGDPNPFVVGAAPYQKFLDVMEGCTRVNIARRQA